MTRLNYIDPYEIDHMVYLLDVALKSSSSRYVLAVAEEAGEVVGAFNKWSDGRIDKPATRENIIAEIAQLMTCCLLLSRRLGFSSENVFDEMASFINQKTENPRRTENL